MKCGYKTAGIFLLVNPISDILSGMSRPALPKPPESVTIPRRMIREAVLKKLKERDWSLRQLSQASGISYSRIHDWLAAEGVGTRGPKVENVEKILAVLGLRVCDDGKSAKKKGGAK